ncbi:MAG TPA: HAMP domain-containing sensor histidine kinase [Acidobacteriaceae bacterium]|jgi:signal transduction histidine kinase|nr:HAMP domain-containing sensor histidine kinase [Acidobacteriaceae bacterium]
MRPYSLRRRLIAMVLAVECALTLSISGAILFYIWRDHVYSLDQVVRGRADSLLGAVHDAENAADDVTITPEALDLPATDAWMARDAGGRVLARSANWNAGAEKALASADGPRDVTLGRHRFRGVSLHGVRQIDADDTSPGIARPVVIDYASPLAPVYDSVERAARFLTVASGLLLMLTAVVLAWLLRRGLAPLETLSASAAEITPRHPLFRAPETAHAAAELSVLARALEEATHRLEDAFVRQQVFVHDAAHELKTAVTIVKSSLQLLASRPRTAREYARGLETCQNDCARMEELVQRMLQLARFEREPRAPIAGCDVAEVVRDVAAQMERIAEIRQVKLAVEAPPALAALVSQDACASLLANLMLNAVQYTAAGGSVITRVTASNSIVVEVSDTGRGIAPEDLPHLFERFWRGDSSRARSTGGVGLGLSICKAIVDGCGGEISVSSRLGEGTRVTVRLPRAPQDDAPTESPGISESVSLQRS